MVIVTDESIEAAEARGREMLVTAPRAATVRFDAITRKITIDLANGCTYSFPAALVQDLHRASDADLAGVLVDGAGLNLNWPALEVDLLVPALLAGVFGTGAWMTGSGGA